MHRHVGELVKVAWGWEDGSIGKVISFKEENFSLGPQ